MTDWFSEIFLKIIWWIIIWGPLKVIQGFSTVVSYLGGSLSLRLIFGVDQDFNFNGFPNAFYILIGVGVVVGLILFISSLIVSMVVRGNDETLKIKITNGFKYAFIGMSLIFLIPIMILIFGSFLNFLGIYIPRLFQQESTNLADLMYYIGSPDGIGQARSGNFDPPENIGNWNIIIQIIAVLFALISFLLLGIQLVVRTIEIFILFIFSPVIAFSSMSDNGGRLVILKNLILGKYLALMLDVIGFYIGVYVITQLLGIVRSESLDWFASQIMQLFVVCGGCFMMTELSKLASGFIGDQGSLKDTANNVKSTLFGAGALAFGGLKIASLITKNATTKPVSSIGKILSGSRGEVADDKSGIINKSLNRIGQSIGDKKNINPETHTFNKQIKNLSTKRRVAFAQDELKLLNSKLKNNPDIFTSSDKNRMEVINKWLKKSETKNIKKKID
ncbi:Mbov_0396 family ICE element transmembrane protein [Mycoplasma bradburyae]|uniref:Mbov_0396 family ICE element transmembrane protein n=1 Tax=Mycoplasma bradburyae TaxID=2963128 RepID=UPI0023423FBB|nr:hypothetical protein [Mycoplasma bradburyae]